MTTSDVVELSAKVLAPNYRRAPVAFREGRGMRLWDLEGKQYLDFLAGIAVDVLGHCHPKHVEAIQRQAATLIHVSNIFHIPEQAELGRLLVEVTEIPDGRALFCNSGAEACETAIKLARKGGRALRGTDVYEIIVAGGGFHGRTMGALSATMTPKYHEGFEPLVPGFVGVPFNDLGAVERAVGERTAAVMIEPVQGEGGIHVARDDYLRGLRGLCDERGLVLVFDEIQCGFGRTGKWFTYQHAGVTPDIVTLAKGLGGGFPIGAIVARAPLMEVLQPGTHGTTFGGSPLACATAAAVIRTINEENLVANAAAMGDYFMSRLWKLAETMPVIKEVRGRGLMVAMELGIPSDPVVAACLRRGLLVNSVRPTVIRFVPPLIVTRQDIDEAVGILGSVLAEQAQVADTPAGKPAGR
ncbi:MAG TPA: acetylornithine transaminase [bacterium]|nr:acetylornithine transaminase [bacterium]